MVKKTVKKSIKKNNVSKGKSVKKSTKSSKKIREDCPIKFKKIKWTKKVSVEEPVIDSQHKKIFEQINKLCEGVNNEDTLRSVRSNLSFLDKYVKEHFIYEENYMKDLGFPGIKKHQAEHKKFAEFYEERKLELNKAIKEGGDLREILKPHIKEINNFLSEWILEHTAGMDQEYHLFANKKGLIGKASGKTSKATKKEKNGVSSIVSEIRNELINKQRKPIHEAIPSDKLKHKKKGARRKYDFTGVPGFDDLLKNGIPHGNAMLMAGGAGSGKTIFCMQTLINNAIKGKKCLIMTLEEREDRLIEHMEDFGWPVKQLIKKGKLKIKRMNPFDITRNVDALLAKQRGELLIDIDPVLLPKDFSKPDFVVIDSLTAIASAFTGKDESYRIYIEQLFRFLEKTGATSFLITETEQIPKVFSPTGVEEFLADGVVVLYNLKHSNVRENALEVLKLRGAAHEKKIVAMQISDVGITVYPEQEVFSDLD